MDGAETRAGRGLRNRNTAGLMGEMMGMGGPSRPKALTSDMVEGVKEAEVASSQVACECNHGLLVEVMKQAMFKIQNQQ